MLLTCERLKNHIEETKAAHQQHCKLQPNVSVSIAGHQITSRFYIQ